MIQQPTVDHTQQVLRDNLSRELDHQELEDLELWHKGQQLSAVVHTEGWQIAMDTLQVYATQANDDLMNLAPGDPVVPTAHAAAASLVRLVKVFKEDIERAVEAAQRPPQYLQQ